MSHGLMFRPGARVAMLLLALFVACSSKSLTTNSSVDGGADARADGAVVTGCATDQECASKLGTTTPPDCATATCNLLRGACEFAAKDEDGDGHAAADCKATNGVEVVDGDDCDDQNKDLYPGRPAPCSTAEDGGVAPQSFCVSQVSCNSDGTKSGCIPVVSCSNGQVCEKGACVPGCDIAGVIYTPGQANPADPCQTCDVAKSSVWTNAADGQSCGAGLACVGGSCGAQCFIAGMVYPSGTANPANACQVCSPGEGTNAWSSTAAGTSCGGAGEYCNAGACSSSCFIGGQVFAAGTSNPNNSCQICTPTSSATAWTNQADGFTCGNGEVCAAGACGTQCDIASGTGDASTGSVVASGALNPSNSCQSCQPGVSTSSWTNLSPGSPCGTGTGKVCNGAVCSPGCDIGGAFVAAGAANPQNSCQTCQPSSSTTAWSNLQEGTNCGSGGHVCHSSGGAIACTAGCFIGNAYVTPGSAEPGNPCETCQADSTTSWSPLPNDTQVCGTGQACYGGVCATGCTINGSYYDHPEPDPANACLQCLPSNSTTAWTPEPEGYQPASCSGSNFCHAGNCSSGCFIGGAFVAAGTVNGCQYCNTSAPTSWSAEPLGYACASESYCNAAGGTCTMGCFIGGVVYASGASNPSNPCQYCNAATNSWGDWPSGHNCTGGGHCDGAGDCTGGCLPHGDACGLGSDCCAPYTCVGYNPRTMEKGNCD